MQIEKSNITAFLISVSILFLIVWFNYGVESAFYFTLFTVSTSSFILNIVGAYILFMDYKFDFKRNYKWWRYFFVSTPLIIMLTIIFQVKFFLIISSIISLCVLTTLLLYDQIRRFLKRFFR